MFFQINIQEDKSFKRKGTKRTIKEEIVLDGYIFRYATNNTIFVCLASEPEIIIGKMFNRDENLFLKRCIKWLEKNFK